MLFFAATPTEAEAVQLLFVHKHRLRTMSDAGTNMCLLEYHAAACYGLLADDKRRGVVPVTTVAAANSRRAADMIGGGMVVVAAAAKGARWGGCRLTEDTVLLLCQSARNVEVLRPMTVPDWLRVRQAPTGDAEQGLERARQVESRRNSKRIYTHHRRRSARWWGTRAR